jgi:hypothetical protein
MGRLTDAGLIAVLAAITAWMAVMLAECLAEGI